MTGYPSLKPSPASNALHLTVPQNDYTIEYFVTMVITSAVEDPRPCPVYAQCTYCQLQDCEYQQEKQEKNLYGHLPDETW